MKIAFVTPAYYPAVIGASLYCQTLAKGLIKKGHEVDVYVNAPSTYKKNEVVEGVIVKRFYPAIVGYYYISRGMISALVDGKFDIIHSHHYGYFPATAGLVAAKIKKVPHIFGPYYHPPVYGLKKSIATSLYHLTQGYPLLKYSDKVLPHTNIEKHLLKKIGCPEEKMEILPNTVDTKKFKPSCKKKNIVLFVGSLMHEKGADIALDLAERISKERKDTKFIFVGNIIEKGLLDKINRIKGNKNVRFFSNLPEKDLIKLYQMSLILVLPSMYEAFSRVVAEAQSCGCAVVATNVGGLKEVVLDNETGFLVDYGNWGIMKNQINYLLDNPHVARKLGRSGRRHIIKNFDTNVVTKKLLGVYEEVLV